MNRKSVHTPVVGLNSIQFSKLFIFEDDLKKCNLEIQKIIRDLSNKLSKLDPNGTKREIGTTNSFKCANIEDKIEETISKMKEMIENIRETISEKTKKYENNKNIFIKAEYNYIDVFYANVNHKEIQEFYRTANSLKIRECIEAVDGNALTDNKNRLFKIYTIKKETAGIHDKLREKFRTIENITVENITVENAEEKELYGNYLTETIGVAYELYKEITFKWGLVDALQRYGCPLEYSFTVTKNKGEFLRANKLDKEETCVVELKELGEMIQ
ncbi:hypothetical protein ECANGB1_1138 [Enterospora canceri]|uniref:Uncharacterized protein n=1 Tax=Enterospora canceri TaxID=1081671 RepID=A0A1Y1S7W1_9MICR|nr:hypothetical protein ECANGB1_1138 [Enterospora canceri]